ncbi:response regulator [Candidatus Parcubacteria bacterium]|nr:response regulator [Patescibacteria group bacterium]MCG2688506.1 response regulator [Candidatus Parcubacteria bacterium]
MKKILIIDDDKTNQDILSKAFSQKDYQVVSVYNSLLSFEKIAEHKPDLIILDILMPGIDGFQVLETMKEKSIIPKIPIIILTALSEESNFKKSLALGAEDCLLKTDYNPCELVEKVTQRLKNK